MLFGLDGVEIGLIIVFACLFAGIMSGYPVAFAIGGAALISFAILSVLDSSGILVREALDTGSDEFKAVLGEGIARVNISRFRYPEIPVVIEPLFSGGWETAVNRTLSFVVNRMNERVFAGQSIETLLAVAMFVLMGITLERSNIANDLLTAMARVFGPLPGGLAVSVVVVGAFLAASTGIVGATVVTMGLLSLPTMLRHNYSPELATGVIAASGTLGQIIPPSIVIILLGTLAGDLYAAAQETRASLVGCSDALTFLGEAAVLSVGTLFKAAILPGIMLAFLYGLYAFGYALFNPSKAPPIVSTGGTKRSYGRAHSLIWFLAVPVGVIAFAIGMVSFNLAGSQSIFVDTTAEQGQRAELRTNVSDDCKTAMIELHGQEKWDQSLVMQKEIEAGTGALTQEERERTPEQMVAERARLIEAAAPISTGLLTLLVLFGLVLTTAFGVAPEDDRRPLIVGGGGVVSAALADVLFISPLSSPGVAFLILTPPFTAILYGVGRAAKMLGKSEVLRVVFPPLVLILAVLGSILGGITNPTPAAALGAGGAIMLAAYRKMHDTGGNGRIVLISAFALVILLLFGVNFDLRTTTEVVGFERWVAFLIAVAAYHVAFIGLLYACWVLWKTTVLTPVVRETAKVTSMVFTILIGSQMLNLVIISFGGEHYIQDFLRSFDREWVVFLIVMLVLFFLGFVLDFLEIIYIVIPIVGPVIYGGTLDPKWVTIMIAINLQTSFLTPPFGFALFYLRGVAPPSVTTMHIYRGVLPFVLIQVVGLALLWAFPWVVTIVPALLPGG